MAAYLFSSPRPSDSGTEDSNLGAGVSEQEGARPSPPPETDLEEYASSLGVDAGDADLAWVVREAFEAPLPSSWTEHVDAEGRLYFFNLVTEESTWSHPMDAVYRELLGLLRSTRAAGLERRSARCKELVREHLEEVHRRALAQLEGWSGPYLSETGPYWHSERTNVSTWASPIEAWEYELAVRYSVLYRRLLGSGTEERSPDSDAGAGAAESLGLEPPSLWLPLSLANLKGEEEKESARSWYSARDSSRGTSARSVGSHPATPSPSPGTKGGGAAAAAGGGAAPRQPPIIPGSSEPGSPGSPGHPRRRREADPSSPSGSPCPRRGGAPTQARALAGGGGSGAAAPSGALALGGGESAVADGSTAGSSTTSGAPPKERRASLDVPEGPEAPEGRHSEAPKPRGRSKSSCRSNDEDAFEVTFGKTGGLSMPVLEAT